MELEYRIGMSRIIEVGNFVFDKILDSGFCAILIQASNSKFCILTTERSQNE